MPLPQSGDADTTGIAIDLLTNPFVVRPRDPRLLPTLALTPTRAAGLAATRDSLEQLRAASLRPHGWLLTVDGVFYGVSPGALHLGHILLPAPMFISFRDVNPQKRAERAMLHDIAEHAERWYRDSIIAARRTP